jgi:hypothetical protein
MAATVKDVQAVVEGVTTPNTIPFMGKSFTLPDKIAYMAFLIFAKIAKSGVNDEDMEGMSAMYDMIHGCLAPADSDRFDQVAVDERASAEEIFEFVAAVMEAAVARPTAPHTGSSQSGRKTSKKSKAHLRSPEGELVNVGDLR